MSNEIVAAIEVGIWQNLNKLDDLRANGHNKITINVDAVQLVVN